MEMIEIFNQVQNYAEQIEDELIEIRRYIHQNPELSLCEKNTSKYIVKKLKEYNIEEIYDDFYETSVMAVIRGKYPGKTVLLRADMDALPIDEKNNISYKSKIPGIMHACGHDSHVTWLLGAAYILNKLRNNIHGNIKLLFQPAEENLGGADSLLEAFDILNSNPKVDIAIAGHAWPDLDAGIIGIVNGMAMAASIKFKILVKGKGGHGAVPEKTIDPISISVNLYTVLQNIISRRVSPFDNAVLSIGNICCNGSYNIIPDIVQMDGTIRAESYDKVMNIMDKVKAAASGITMANGANYTLIEEKPIHAVYNNYELIHFTRDIINGNYNDHIVKVLDHGAMTGEDFCYFSEKVPSLFMYIGCRNEKKGIIAPLHNCNFNIDESILRKTAEALSILTIKYLDRSSN